MLKWVRPDEVHINLPTRPPAETWVQPPDEKGLLRALAILGDVARVVHLETWVPGQVDKILTELFASGQAQVVERYGIRFWSASPAYYSERSTQP